MNDANKERLRLAVAEAAEKVEALKQRQAELSQCTEPARIGYLYVVPSESDVAFSWLVVNLHPDDSNLALVVPVTDFPLIGVCDVTLPTLAPDVARCGFAHWVVRSELKQEERVDGGWSWLLLAFHCRKVLHRMATGQELQYTAEQDTAENDPEYEDHCEEVEAEGRRQW